MQTGLAQKPAADDTGGSRANALTLHVMSARTPVLAGIIARAAHRNWTRSAVELAAAVARVPSAVILPYA